MRIRFIALLVVLVSCYTSIEAQDGPSGAKGQLNVTSFGPTGTSDDTATFTKAVAAGSSNGVGIGSVYVPPGHYRICNLQLTPSIRFYGDSPRLTVLESTAGCRGSVITDNGNATGIYLQGFQVDARHEPGITAAIKLGFGNIPFGTEGLLSQVYARNANAGFCFQINGNIATMRDLESDTCRANEFAGTGNVIDGMSSGNASLKGIEDIGTNNTYTGLIEIEAPGSGSIPISIEHMQAHVYNPIISLSNSTPTNINSLIYVAPGASGTRITGIQVFRGQGTFNNVVAFGNAGYPNAIDFPPAATGGGPNMTALASMNASAAGGGGSKTAWTPVATGLIQTGGGANISGYYEVIGSLVYVEIAIAPAVSTSSIAGTTHFSLPIPSSTSSANVSAASGSGRNSYPGGLISSGNLFPASWSADNHTVVVSGWYLK